MKINGFSKTYNGKTVLKTDEITIKRGRIYAIIGANGSGKSTFAKVISGIEKADNGKRVFEENITVGYMPQKSFAFRMSVEDNVTVKIKDEEKAETLMNKLGVFDLKDKNAKTLSGGETAKMALARVLMEERDILILDEPCASMDMESTLISEGVIREFVTGTVFIITHSLAQAKRVSDEVLFFDKGEIVEIGETNEVLTNSKNERTRKFVEF